MEENKVEKPINETTFKKVRKAFTRGSLPTKLSFIFMGYGQIARGQIVKGLLYVMAQTAFILFLIFFGGKYST